MTSAVSADLKERAMEYAHHGDPLVPRQQRFGKYTRSLMKGLGVPVENRCGLRPATVQGTNRLVPLQSRQGSGYPGMAHRVHDFQFPHASAALRGDDRRSEGHSRVGAATDGYVQAASVHRGRKQRVQYVSVDAARTANGPVTFCWRTPRSSPRCSVATKAWRASGRISRPSDANRTIRPRAACCVVFA